MANVCRQAKKRDREGKGGTGPACLGGSLRYLVMYIGLANRRVAVLQPQLCSLQSRAQGSLAQEAEQPFDTAPRKIPPSTPMRVRIITETCWGESFRISMHNPCALIASALVVGLAEGLNPRLLGDSNNLPHGHVPGGQISNFHPGEPAFKHVADKQQPAAGHGVGLGGGIGVGLLGKFLRKQDAEAIAGRFLRVLSIFYLCLFVCQICGLSAV